MMRQACWSFLSAALLLCGAGGSAQAGIVFQLGNNPQPDEENILFGSPQQTGTTVFGHTNQSNTTVQFSSTTDTLHTPSAGQAKVEAVDGSLNNISITVPSKIFHDFIMNPFNGSGTATVTVVANEPGGGQQTFTFSYTLGNGQNFLTMFAMGGETIESVTIDSPGGFGFVDLRQPRISGIGDPIITTSTPEPASMILLGIGAVGLVGYGIRRRRGVTQVV